MREDPLWARIALLLNLAGTGLLFLSFQATSSDFRLLTATNVNIKNFATSGDKVYAICVNDSIVAASNPKHDLILGSGAGTCPQEAKSAAVVNTEHPSFIYAGLICSALGFLLQLATVPRRKTLAEVNEEMRILRKQKKMFEAGSK